MNTTLMWLFLVLSAVAPPQQNGSVAGFVTRIGTGEPVARARVVIVPESAPSAPLNTLTETDGKFLVTNVPPGNYRLFARHDGYLSGEYGQTRPGKTGVVIAIAARESRKDLGVTLTPTGAIAGRVFDRFGEPLSNANVQASRYVYFDGQRTLSPVQSARTNDLGEYRLYFLQPGRYLVSALPVDLVRNDSGTLLIEMVPGNPLQVSGGPTNGTVRMGGNTGAALGLVSAADLGEAFVPVFYPGTIEASTAAYIEVAPGSNLTGFDMTASPVRALRLAGTVTGPGGQAAAATVSLMSRGGSPISGATVSRSASVRNGTFEFRGLPPGSYELIALATSSTVAPPPPPPVQSGGVQSSRPFAEGSRLIARQQVELVNFDLETIGLTLQPGYTVTARLSSEGQSTERAPNNSASLANIRAQLRPEGALPGLTVVSNPIMDGVSFALTGVALGNYRLTLSGLMRSSYIKSARLGGEDVLNSGLHIDGEPRAALDIVIAHDAGAVDAAVLDEAQKPVRDAVVVLVPDPARRQRSELYRNMTTDASGHARLAGVPPGDYKVFAWEDIETGAWQDPDFLRTVEDRGRSIHVGAGGRETVEVRIIP